MAEAMRWLEGSFLAFAHLSGPVFVAALWQGALVVAGMELLLRAVPGASARDRFRAWAAALAALAVLPFLPFLFTALRTGSSPAAAPSVIGGAAARAWFDLDPRWTLAIASLWILVAFTRVAALAIHMLRLRRLWKEAVPVPSLACPSLPGLPASPGRRLEVCTTQALDRPSVIGFFRPRILIPEWLIGKLTPAELEQVVLHESEHLRRGDDWTNLVQKLLLAVFPLHPALAWIERRLCREREMACDEAVVRATEKPRSYAACLASLAERGLERGLERAAARRPEALSLGAWRRRPELAERVHRILRRAPGLPPAAARALLGVVGCGLVFASVELARIPQVVAFVGPVAAQAAPLDAAAGLAPAAYAGDSMRGVHAVNTAFRVPETSQGIESRADALQPALAHTIRRRAAAPSAFSAAQAPYAQVPYAQATPTARRGRMVATSLRPRGAERRQWVVVAAWEQVQTAAAPAPAESTLPAPADRGPALATRIIYTRLLVIYPAEARANAGVAGANARPAPKNAGRARQATGSSLPATEAAIPLRDGWLVFQL